MFPTVGPVESLIVRLPGTSTSCASAGRSGRKQRSTTENRSVLPLIFLKLITDSLLTFANGPNRDRPTRCHIPRRGRRSTLSARRSTPSFRRVKRLAVARRKSLRRYACPFAIRISSSVEGWTPGGAGPFPASKAARLASSSSFDICERSSFCFT